MSLVPPSQVPPSTTSDGSNIVAHLERRVCALQEENDRIMSKISGRRIQTLSRESRIVRRLVTLAEPVSDLIAEYDRRQLALHEQTEVAATEEQERTFKSFEKLIQWCPTVLKMLNKGEFDLSACREVQANADGARGDDACTLKREVIEWISELNTDRGDPPLTARDKERRGMNHMVTGRLLCPVDYNWEDPDVRARIRDYDPDFRVTAYSWPVFLFKGYRYNSANPSDGLFQSDLLVQSFQCIFTSPSSARRYHESLARPLAKKKSVPKSRRPVAELVRMRSVQPRAIAYAAVQLRFALSSATSWAVVDEDFDNITFYYHIVDYFENPESESKANEIKTLLLWWNRIVFGRRNVCDYRPLNIDSLSVARSRK